MANFLKKLFGGNDKGAGEDGGNHDGDGPTLAEPDLTIARE
ncbi:hypothetical protein N0A02_20395 [Paraburkholderia acidicola]|uniref:Peptidoglycan-binding protein LysM n=1 Tax=Paraburkholderia acidicola TaxID=1912599 RepID=A0ABV1LR59_9BURK